METDQKEKEKYQKYEAPNLLIDNSQLIAKEFSKIKSHKRTYMGHIVNYNKLKNFYCSLCPNTPLYKNNSGEWLSTKKRVQTHI